MPKPGSGGGGKKASFDLSKFGPPPGGLTANKEEWIDLLSIPSGSKLWFGTARYTSPDKTFTFELRTNLTGESQGTVAKTDVLYKASVSSRKGTVTIDMYKNGRLHISSVLGTGSEKVWLRLVSKKQTAASYLYDIYYAVEQ